MKVLVLGLATLVACKGGKKNEEPPPVTGSGSGSPTVQAPPPPDNTPPPSSFPQTITADGVGAITAATAPGAVGPLFPGLEGMTAHTEGQGASVDDTALGWKGGATVLHVIVDNVRAPGQIYRVDVVGSAMSTAAGIHVGSTVAELVTKYPETECKRETLPDKALGFDHALDCMVPSLPTLGFYLPAETPPGTDGKVLAAKIQSLKIDKIIWRPVRVAAPPPTGEPGGAEYCFEAGADFVIDRMVASDDAVTFCAPQQGALTCVTASLATGAFTTATGTPPAKPEPVPVARTNPDNTQKVQRTAKGVTLMEAKTNKELEVLTAGDKDYKCVEEAQFLGTDVYVTMSMCDQPKTAGWIFGPDGKQIGDKLDAINLKDARPFHLAGDRWLFRANDTDDVMFVSAANGDIGVVPTLTAAEAKKATIRTRATIAPLTLTPKRKVVEIGSAVALIDLSTGKAEHAWPLPECKH